MSVAKAAHGALLAMEKDGGVAGTFTSIAELNSDLSVGGLTRGESEVTPHNEGIDSYVFGVLRREPWTFSVNFIFDNDTHDHLTGLQKRILDGDTFGLRFRGPSGAADTHEIIASGQITAFNRAYPVREGAITADVTFRCSGAMIIDGVSIT